MLDCLRPCPDAPRIGMRPRTSASSSSPSTRYFADAGILDSFIATHGASPTNAPWRQPLQTGPTRSGDDSRRRRPQLAGFFTAYGRDVDVHEGRLSFRPRHAATYPTRRVAPRRPRLKSRDDRCGRGVGRRKMANGSGTRDIGVRRWALEPLNRNAIRGGIACGRQGWVS